MHVHAEIPHRPSCAGACSLYVLGAVPVQHLERLEASRAAAGPGAAPHLLHDVRVRVLLQEHGRTLAATEVGLPTTRTTFGVRGNMTPSWNVSRVICRLEHIHNKSWFHISFLLELTFYGATILNELVSFRRATLSFPFHAPTSLTAAAGCSALTGTGMGLVGSESSC